MIKAANWLTHLEYEWESPVWRRLRQGEPVFGGTITTPSVSRGADLAHLLTLACQQFGWLPCILWILGGVLDRSVRLLRRLADDRPAEGDALVCAVAVDPEGVLPEAERIRRAEHARKAYFTRLALKSAQARRRKREANAAKVRQGVVVSDKGEKTITVAIDVVKRHKRYHKIMRSTVKLYAHDERNDAHEGDTVRVQECRPMSRSKRWRLIEVLERAK